MEPEKENDADKNYFDKGEEDKTIISFVQWENPPKDPDELANALEWIRQEIIKSFLMNTEQLFRESYSSSADGEADHWRDIMKGKENGEEPQGIIFGASPIQQSKELIQRAKLITSCICCKHWKINDKETRLVGTCERTLETISYDRVCDQWEKI